MAQALDGVRRCYERAGHVTYLRLHGDCHAGNVLWTDSAGSHGPHFVGFDDAHMEPAVQDLWMLLSGERAAATTPPFPAPFPAPFPDSIPSASGGTGS